MAGKIDITPNTVSVFTNTEQDLIIITKDKLKLKLIDTKAINSSKKDWQVPAGLFATTVVTLITTDNFKAWLFPAEVWHAIFVLVSLFCFIWLLYELYFLWKYWNKGEIDTLLNDITKKKESPSE